MVVSIALLLVIIGIIAKTSNNHKKASRRLAIEKKKHLERIAAQSKVLADIANIQSHDVRGQVTTIMGLVQLFNFEDTTDPTNSVIIHGIAEVTEKLDTIIKDLVIKENTLSRSTREDNYI
jgi:signal transduction histidine kinase